MKVAQFTDTYLPQNNGVARALSELHNSKKEFEDEVFAPVGHKGVEKVRSLPLPLSPDYGFALSTSSIIKKVRGFDLVHVHTPYPMFYYGWKCARELKLPLVGSFHTDPSAFFGHVTSVDSSLGKFSSKLIWRYLIWLYNLCDAVIVPSENLASELKARGIKKPIFVVPNGVDTTVFSPEAKKEEFMKKYGIPAGKRVVLFIGRIEKRKRPDIFVEAAIRSKSEAVFVVAGSGPMKKELQQSAKNHKNIIFTGYLPHEMVPKAFAATDLFVFTSEMETQGIVLVEAMASGCAVLSSDVGAAGEMLEKEFLLDSLKPKQVASRIDALVASQKLDKIKESNRKKIAENYSKEVCMRKLIGVYSNVLGRFNDTLVSVIVPTYNEISDIGDCLASISRQDYKNLEILVADGGSTDGTVEIAEKAGKTRVIHCGNTGGPGPARNIAAKQANGKILAFTDADTRVADNWVHEIVYDFESDPELLGVGGVLRPYEPRRIDRVMFKINSDWFYRLTAMFGFYQLATPNCAYRKGDFLNIGGFNEEISMFEDTDLSVRMGKIGKLKIDKSLVVYNSTRRVKKEGYGGLFLRYMKVYYRYFTGKSIKERHFDTIEH